MLVLPIVGRTVGHGRCVHSRWQRSVGRARRPAGGLHRLSASRAFAGGNDGGELSEPGAAVRDLVLPTSSALACGVDGARCEPGLVMAFGSLFAWLADDRGDGVAGAAAVDVPRWTAG